MNRKFLLALVSSPALFASMISMVVIGQPAHAGQKVSPNVNPMVCVNDPHSAQNQLSCVRRGSKMATPTPEELKIAQAPSDDKTELQFTDEESDSAIAMFGCDCPSCLNALRQLRGLPGVPGTAG